MACSAALDALKRGVDVVTVVIACQGVGSRAHAKFPSPAPDQSFPPQAPPSNSQRAAKAQFTARKDRQDGARYRERAPTKLLADASYSSKWYWSSGESLAKSHQVRGDACKAW